MTVDPIETSELIWVLVGVGTGVGVGVGVGGGGVGGGVGDCANAVDAKAIDNAHARQSAATAASQRRAPVPLSCDGRIEQRMDAKFRNGRAQITPKVLVRTCRFALSSDGGSIGDAPTMGAIAAHCAPAATGRFGKVSLTKTISQAGPEAC
jgi:hypothetical protein